MMKILKITLVINFYYKVQDYIAINIEINYLSYISY